MYRASKYGAHKVQTEEGKFDSKHELKRWNELKLLERAGEISDLKRQVKYELIPSQKINGKTIERSCTYIADFEYIYKGSKVVEYYSVKATDRKNYYKVVIRPKKSTSTETLWFTTSGKITYHW